MSVNQNLMSINPIVKIPIHMGIWGLIFGGVAVGLQVASTPYYYDEINVLVWVGILGSVVWGGFAGLFSGVAMAFATQVSFRAQVRGLDRLSYLLVMAVIASIVTAFVCAPFFPHLTSDYGHISRVRLLVCLTLAICASQLTAMQYFSDCKPPSNNPYIENTRIIWKRMTIYGGVLGLCVGVMMGVLTSLSSDSVMQMVSYWVILCGGLLYGGIASVFGIIAGFFSGVAMGWITRGYHQPDSIVEYRLSVGIATACITTLVFSPIFLISLVYPNDTYLPIGALVSIGIAIVASQRTATRYLQDIEPSDSNHPPTHLQQSE